MIKNIGINHLRNDKLRKQYEIDHIPQYLFPIVNEFNLNYNGILFYMKNNNTYILNSFLSNQINRLNNSVKGNFVIINMPLVTNGRFL